MMTLDLLTPRSSTIISTHAFQEFHNDRPASRESRVDAEHTRKPKRDDVLESIIPRPGAIRAMNSSQQLLRENESASGGGRNHYLSENSHLKQRSFSSGPISDALSTREDEESNFGDFPPSLMSSFNNPVNTSESSAPSPERRSTRSSSRNRVPVPARRSSRARSHKNDRRSDVADRGDHDSEVFRGITAAEVESAYKLLAATEQSNYGPSRHSREPSAQTDRSATPPPIGRTRRRADKASECSDTAQSLRPTTPETAVFLEEAPPLPRRESQASFGSHRSQRSHKTRSQRVDTRGSVPEQVPSARESRLLPPGTRNSSRPRSRKARGKEFDDVEEDLGLRPRHVNESYERSSTHRHNSISTNTSSRRPVTTAKRIFGDDALSVSKGIPTDRRSIVSHSSSTRLPDFFSYEIFQVVLHNPATAHQLLKFSETRVCSENIEFLNKVDEYQKALGNLTTVLGTMHKDFMSHDSDFQLDVPHDVMRSVYKDIKSLARKTIPNMETLFTDMQARIEELVFSDVYPRFVRHQLALSATQALASDRHRYAGLGDCFCLTNPNKADNPIVFASDGFVKVTGYGRPEIIPRNCRFLQGPQTDRVPIRRLKQGIRECKESVELILNYKKNGDPFWNLLYVAPLYDENGKLSFFIGGQVNCSTTIHSNADIMKVLSLSASGEAQDETKETSLQAPQRHGALPSARKAFLKAFGVRVDEAKAPLGPAGMEHKVLGRMEGQDLDAQLKEFYTAYSKYLVVRADNFVIAYYSEGVLEALNPANNTALITGQEVFRFFRQNMVTKETDYRSKVRSAVRSGTPISVELRLQTRRSARFRGDEVFATHWTPLKDENAATHWVVIALASTMF
ncbi:hypothetical protein SCARD494_07647 [Seiridium cardinale]